jgi:hypothetical protein
MTEVSVVGPGDGEVIRLGSTQMRILEDGHTTGHRLGLGEITLAPHTEGPPQRAGRFCCCTGAADRTPSRASASCWPRPSRPG